MSEPDRFEPLVFQRLSPEQALRRVSGFRDGLRRRRTVREFSSEPV